MLNELTNQEKIDVLKFKLSFWMERLKESNDAIESLNTLKNQLKIDQNAENIKDINTKILFYQQEIDRLSQ